ncbi:MAG: MBL fold metallo-hydrolase [Deltaproteobacteria bacterium]|nr:MBL fold metallo-hydrolase [Deltaproteobacteria bacterium]
MDRVFRLELPTPFPVGPANAWWLDGPEPMLIDAGAYTRESLSVLEAGLASRGRRLEEVRRVLLTHDHVDHAGSAGEIARRSGARVSLHERGRLTLQRSPEEIAAVGAFLSRCGLPGELIARAWSVFRRSERVAAPEPVTESAIDRLKGGDEVESPLGPLTVLATPGHSPDHLCFLAREAGLLFCGDTLLADITPNPILYLDPEDGFRRSPSLLAYLDSLAMLAELPLRLAHPGHGPDIPDAAALIAQNLAFVESRKRDFIAAAGGGAASPYALARAVFGEQDVIGQFLALSETVAYLDLLERDEGFCVAWDEDPIRIACEER